jgi:uncharacterized membrane protein
MWRVVGLRVSKLGSSALIPLLSKLAFAAALPLAASCTVDREGFAFGSMAGASGEVGGAGGSTANAGGATTAAGWTSSGASGKSGVASTGCAAEPCQNAGTCSDRSGGGYQCECVDGYGGTRCEIEIDDCAVDRCKNGGVCADRVNDYHCQCSAGYQGKNCELATDDCAGLPCQNGGECRDGNARYTCVCQPGFSGIDCERRVSGCDDDPCLNGQCSETAAGYSCSCEDGFQGLNCEVVLDECRDAPCQHGGVCSNQSPGFACQCPEEWTGKTCELDVDECASPGVCPEGRSCVNSAGGYECPCSPGGVGPDCERVFDLLPSIEGLDTCTALDVNADGSVVVGWCLAGNLAGGAFRWTVDEGLEVLTGLPGAGARRVSDDGNVIAGEHTGSVFRWTRSTGMVDLAMSGSAAMNASGSVIAAGDQRWTASGKTSIAPLIDAAAMSADGNVIAGHGEFGQRSYRWTPDSELYELLPPAGMTNAAAVGMSTDGSVIVGYAYAVDAVYGVIWKGAEITSSNTFPWFSDVSGNGAVMAVRSPGGIWDQTNGLRDLRELLNARGAAVPDGDLYVTAISRDGRYVVGELDAVSGQGRAFRAKLP